jgi:ABC-type antimicrobial peptide transport system permease subunit
LISVGLLVGVPAALAAATLIRGQLYGVEAQDPLTLLATSLMLVLVAMAAGYFPAWRASRVDPMVALRRE